MKRTLLLLAGGSGERMGAGFNKVFLRLDGKTCFRRSLDAFSGRMERIVIVCRSGDEDQIRGEVAEAALSVPWILTTGGETRQASVLHGLRSVSWDEEDWVMVHDAARCLVSPSVIDHALACSLKWGNAVPCIAVTDTIKEVLDSNRFGQTLSRSSLRAIQTPQIFPGQQLLDLSLRAEKEGFTGTDDASLLEHYGLPVFCSDGSPRNIKLTRQEDLLMANAILGNSAPMMRVGQGYDVHRLVEGRKLILCGVEIPWEKGLLGHSDADVALHALMDAMLGAASLGDIGQHFPDTDPRYKGVSSLLLLKESMRLLSRNRFSVGNVDITIIAQKPKIAPWIPAMKEKVAEALSLAPDRVSVKATTTEHLGFEGREEGISAQAVCLIYR